MQQIDQDASSDQNYEVYVKEEIVSQGNQGQSRRLSTVAQRLVDKPIEKPLARRPQTNNQSLVPPSSSAKLVKLEKGVPPPPRPRIPRSQRSTQQEQPASPFSIPQGSQVVSLLTSSSEPDVEEDYAEDDVDETYHDDGSQDLPSGAGWVTKKRNTTRNASRGFSMPPASAAAAAMPRESRTMKMGSSSQGTRKVGLNRM